VFVPDCDVVGAPGDGWRIAMSTAGHERGLSLRSPRRFSAAARAARAALQVHGAMGYTAEHDLCLWLTKVRALTGAWGSAAWHRGRVLTELAKEGSW
jgi:alkylation response protein AidB-like acyl-CoA dehydrogenase